MHVGQESCKWTCLHNHKVFLAVLLPLRPMLMCEYVCIMVTGVALLSIAFHAWHHARTCTCTLLESENWPLQSLHVEGLTVTIPNLTLIHHPTNISSTTSVCYIVDSQMANKASPCVEHACTRLAYRVGGKCCMKLSSRCTRTRLYHHGPFGAWEVCVMSLMHACSLVPNDAARGVEHAWKSTYTLGCENFSVLRGGYAFCFVSFLFNLKV